MSEWTNAAKVGAMTIALSAALYTGWRFISRETGTEDGYDVWAYLDDVTGVAPRSRVMISGVQVGVVDDIELADNGEAKVTIRMMPEHELYEDAAIGKKASSLIGDNFIILTPGTKGRERIPDGGQIKYYIEEATLESLQGQVRDILVDVKAVTGSLRDTVGSDRGQEQIDRILENLAQTTEQLNAMLRENRAGVRETINNVNNITARSQPEILAILQNIRELTQEVKELTAEAGAPGEKPGDIRQTAENLNKASQKLDSLLQHADNVAARIDRGEGTVGRLTKDEKLINEVEEVVEGVNSLVGGLTRIQTVVSLRSDYNFLANTVKSYVSLRLQPAEDKYYLIQLVNDPRGLTTYEQIDVDTTNPNDPPHYREIRTVTTNSFRFTFQFAKRFGPFTGRFGILESTGGIGLDLHLLDDRFELQQDFFGFGEQITPRWRLSLSYEFVRKLWLLGGIDNILSDDRRDYFFGLELRFNDEDLKSILPFAPTGAIQ